MPTSPPDVDDQPLDGPNRPDVKDCVFKSKFPTQPANRCGWLTTAPRRSGPPPVARSKRGMPWVPGSARHKCRGSTVIPPGCFSSVRSSPSLSLHHPHSEAWELWGVVTIRCSTQW